MILVPVFLFAFALSIRLSGGIWGAQPTNDEYMARQAEYIYTYGHPAVPDPYSASELYQPAMAYLLALVGHVFDIVPLKMGMSSMTISEGIVPPILGALTVVVIYWLGTELYDRRAGIIAGIFASVSYPLLMRGLKGYTFHNALSLLLIVLTAVIIIRAIDTLKKPFPKKTQQQLLYIVNLFLPAVLIGFTGFAWGGLFYSPYYSYFLYSHIIYLLSDQEKIYGRDKKSMDIYCYHYDTRDRTGLFVISC
ncbi:MAG: Asparagine N-glycosylation enzyme, membrane subunit Stt3 [Candidatus Methanomarinus sp.]|nr:MAG: Asparagine N-glycosylation enzyme, membrane subunit Stt3 [ANME-2 cluster archaeon]